MTLAGQGKRGIRRTDGFAMAALLVGIAVMGVLMAIAMPVWRQMAIREKEAELVFRGEQYARGIALFQRKYPGAFPPSLDALVEQKFVRKPYKDPMTKDGEFQPIYMAQAAGGRGPGVGAGPGSGRGTVGSGPVMGQTPGQGQPMGGAAGQQGAAGGMRTAIIGVASKSTDESIMIYKGHSHYNEWQFLFSQVSGQPGGQGVPQGLPQPGMGRPGQPGQRPGPGMGFPGGGRGPGGTRGPGGIRGPGTGPGGVQPRPPGGGPGGS